MEDRLYAMYKEILSQLMKQKNAHHFFNSVIPETDSVQEYNEQISNSMSFCQMQTKIDNREYPDPNLFISDLMLIWRNAKLYNNPRSEIHRSAHDLARRSQILVATLPHFYKDDEKVSGLNRYVELRINRYRLLKKSHL